MKPKVLFIDTAHPSLQDQLEALGYQCDYFSVLNYENYISIIDQYYGVIVRNKIPIDKQFLEAAKQLKFIGRVGAGMENIDVNHAQQQGITCLNAPEGNRDAVAEHAIGMLLSLFNHLSKANDEVRKGIWKREENRGVEIKGKTIGLIGYGNTGAAFAQKLSGFEANVIAYDKFKQGFGNDFVKEVTMEHVFAETDVLSFHVPLTADTRYLFTSDYLSRFRKPIYLINTSRGEVVNTEHLLDGLKSGRVLGACLDVLEYEKFSFEDIQLQQAPKAFMELIRRQDVLLSPHIAGWTHESNVRMAQVLASKIGQMA